MSQQDSTTVARASATLSIPDHELVRPIASGSYGEVWLARNAVGTLRAVKIVRRDRHASIDSFEREFKGLQKFEPVSRSHDGLVDILTLGLFPDGAGFYYVMELADSSSNQCSVSQYSVNPTPPTAHPRTAPLTTDSLITDLLITDYSPRTLRFDLKTRGALPADEVIALGLKLTAAIAHLHAQGLVHRDIKPSNILFVGGVPKLADAGLVAAMDDARSLVGTTGYIAPEGPGSPQADLYALGKVLYEAAFGKDRQDFPQLPPDLRSRPDHARLLELNAVLLKACAADRHERYQSAEQMRADLELLRADRSVKRRQAWQEARRLAVRLAIATAVVVAGYLGIHSLRRPLPVSDRVAELLRTRGTTNQEAYNAHQMGRFYYGKQNQRQLRLAEDYFKKAIQFDPNYVSAYVGLVDTYNSDGGADPRQFVPKVRALGEKIVAIAPDRPEGYMALGHCKFYEWQWTESERLLRHAIRLNDDYLMAHFELAWLLLIQCRFDEAGKELRRGEQTDPTSMDIHLGLVWLDLGQRNFDAAVSRLKLMHDMEPGSDLPVPWLLGVSEGKGDLASAVQQNEKRELQYGQPADKVAAYVQSLRNAIQDRGADGYWRTKLAYMKSVHGTFLDEVAGCHAKIGETDQALAILERMADENHANVLWFKFRSQWDFTNLRTEPRFHALLKRVGLEP